MDKNAGIFKGALLKVEEVAKLVQVHITKRATSGTLRANSILINREVSPEVPKIEAQVPPMLGEFKFNIVEQGKLGPVRSVFQNNQGLVLALFSKHARIVESNEVEVAAILGALRIVLSSSLKRLVVESDFLNAISWVSSSSKPPWRFHFYLNESKCLASTFQVEFKHVCHSENSFASCLVKQRQTRL